MRINEVFAISIILVMGLYVSGILFIQTGSQFNTNFILMLVVIVAGLAIYFMRNFLEIEISNL